MADSPQTLQEFTQNLLTDLTSGAISVHEAFAAANQYAFLRQELSDASLSLSEAAAVGDEELTAALAGVISRTIEKISELPNFQSQQPDNSETEEKIRDVAALQKTATTRIREAVRSRPSKEKRREFVHSLVDRFSSTIPTLSEKDLDGFIDGSAVAAARVPAPEQQGKFTQHLEASIENLAGNMSDDQKKEVSTLIQSTASGQQEYIKTQVAETKRELAIYTALFGATELARPDVFADVALNAPPSESLGESLTRAEKLARVAQSLEEAAGEHGGKLQFFSADGAKGVLGGLQKGADGILSLIGEPAREMLLHEKVNGTLQSMLTSTQQFADRLGENFVHSALFTHISQDLTKQLAQKPQGGGARNIVDDVFSSVFRGPLSAPLARSTKSGILDFYELARANAAAPKGKTFLPPGMLPWEAFRVFETRKASARYTRSRLKTGALFPLFGLGSLGSFFSNIFSSLVDRTTSFTLLNPRLPGQLSASRRAAGIPTPLVDDMPLMVALIVIIVLVLLFIFPSPLNLNTITHSSKISALLAALQNDEGEVGGPGSSVDCKKNPTNPLCSFKSCTGDCRWPTSGYITQGPNVTCSKSSHNGGSDANGVDIATVGSPNTAVYAIDGGTIVAVSTGCADNSGALGNSCGGGWGNYVTINHTNGYRIIYAHLKSAVNPAIKVGASISARDQIGWMDQTGNSSGQHLHFGVVSGGNVLDVLPDTPVNKSDILGCNSTSAQCIATGNGCPATPVSAQ